MIAYVQYTNPAGYPPLAHSSRILADRGWQVLFLGTDAIGDANLRLEDHPRIRVLALRRPGGALAARAHYVLFCLWTLWHVVRSRPAWLYASDPLAALPALLASAATGTPVIYHEHDAPSRQGISALTKLALRFRAVLARRAALDVLPAEGRIGDFVEATGASRDRVVTVRNCPARREASLPVARHDSASTWLYYHGSINAQRLPIALAEALRMLPREIGLRIAGYETIGSRGCVDAFLARAAALGVERDRFDYRGCLQRREMLQLASACDIGLMFVPLQSGDINMRAMVGASNKSYEYMLCGLPQLVSPLPEWIAAVAAPGYGIACDPTDAQALAEAMLKLHEDRGLRRTMGADAHRRICDEWNYETEFAPVLERLERGNRGAAK